MVRLKVLMGNHPQALPLKRGEIGSDLVALDFADIRVPHEAFKPFVRDLAYDLGELAIVTFLQAFGYGKDLMLLPFVVSARFHHASLGYPIAKGRLGPKDLEGRVVAVRTYSQTTGVWVRAILQHQYGVDLAKLRFMTFDEAHLAEYRDPPNCFPAPPGSKLDDMLLAAEVDAGIPIALASNLMSDPRLALVIPDPKAAAAHWYAQNRAPPINHMLVMRKSMAVARPDVAREVWRLFVAGRDLLPPLAPGAIDMLPCGIENNRHGLEIVVQYALEQGIIPRPLEVDELFADARRLLGEGI